MLRNDELTKNGTIIFFASLIAGFFNYLYQIYMGRALGPEDYGIFGALFAIFYIFGVISQTLGTSMTRFVSKFIGEGKPIGFLIKRSIEQMAIFGIIISIILLIINNYLMDIFKISDNRPILILILILFLACIDTIFGGVLRGVKKFGKLGFVNISNSFSKMSFGIIFVAIGFGVSGALMGAVFGIVVGMIFSIYFIKDHINIGNNSPEFRSRDFYFYSLPVLAAMISYSVPSNLDVILAKYFFSPVEAGIYNSVAILGKIIFFFPGAIGTVIFPMIVEKHIRKENCFNILKRGILYTGTLSGSIALIYLLFPWLVVKIFGDKYMSAIGMVGIYGIAMFLFSVIGIIMTYHLAIKDMRYVGLFTIFTIIEVSLLGIFHSSMVEMIDILAAGNLVFLVTSMIYTFRSKESRFA